MDTGASPIRLLYIDDDQGICRLVQRHLKRAGYDVTVSNDGESGIALARTGDFDVIALDHYMPGRDGLEVLADLRRLPAAPPVVFVTASEEPRIAVSALKEGALDYVVKDVQGAFLDFLGTAIEQAVAHGRLRRAKELAERELRESRDRLEKLTVQQALMLKEVNHRVSNSLQLISSLIGLQARKVVDPEARTVLRHASDRVDAVSLVHRRLYNSNDIALVEMSQYLGGLVDELRRALAAERGGTIELSADPIRVKTDMAVSIGLIVNELVTNAVKYAYPGPDVGSIRIDLHRQADDAAVLTVEDDGIGYPGEGFVPSGSGLGATIVSAMARTVQATVELDRSHKGTRFILGFAI